MRTQMMFEEGLPGSFVFETILMNLASSSASSGVYYFVEAGGKARLGPFTSIDEGERAVFGMTTAEYTGVLGDMGVK